MSKALSINSVTVPAAKNRVRTNGNRGSWTWSPVISIGQHLFLREALFSLKGNVFLTPPQSPFVVQPLSEIMRFSLRELENSTEEAF